MSTGFRSGLEDARTDARGLVEEEAGEGDAEEGRVEVADGRETDGDVAGALAASDAALDCSQDTTSKSSAEPRRLCASRPASRINSTRASAAMEAQSSINRGIYAVQKKY